MTAPARTIRIAPTNSFDAEEMAVIAMSQLQRAVFHPRWEHILIDAIAAWNRRDPLHSYLVSELGDLASRFESALVHSGTDVEFARQATAKARCLISKAEGHQP